MTPITAKRKFKILSDLQSGTREVVDVETARELEEMCEELYQAANYWTPEEYAPPALTRYQAMKEKAK